MKLSHSLPAGAFALAASLYASGASAQTSTCPLNNGPIQHVVYLQFDNVHFVRDNINVPSDVEQMPHLYNFLVSNGILSANNHTQLISHTANGILSSITGVYPDRIGSAISNSFAAYTPAGTLIFPSDFVYWTDLVQTSSTSPTADHAYTLISEKDQNAPAPWVPYTRAGCDFGAVALADMEFENTTSDIANVFGTSSPEYQEGKSNSYQATADFEGISIHCAKGSAICAASTHAAADVLPQEPGGYTGFQALFGHKYAVPVINGGSAVLTDLLGGPIQYQDYYKGVSTIFNGFPGFDGMSTKVTLSYVAHMLEAGVPVVYGYFADAHDDHDPTNPHAYGPGEAGYVAQLKDYDAEWAAFFTRLQADGITAANTLFVITTEEGDHFAGSTPTPSSCNGVTTPCTYSAVGEQDADYTRLLATQRGNTTPLDLHYDMSPGIYVHGSPPPNPESAVVRQLELDSMALMVSDQYIPGSPVPLFVAISDQADMKLLHMITADPLRTPSFVGWGNEDFYIDNTNTSSCNTGTPCVTLDDGYAWNHGGIQSKIATTWLGIAGPGVKKDGLDQTTWTDHTDIRPTMLQLLGLVDDYEHDGRVLVEHLNPAVLPASIASNLSAYETLSNAYKQLTAPFGQTATASIVYATAGVNTANAATHSAYLSTIANFTTSRDALAAQIRDFLEQAEFSGATFNPATAASLTSQATALTAQMVALARSVQ
jgi:hypothetical protein